VRRPLTSDYAISQTHLHKHAWVIGDAPDMVTLLRDGYLFDTVTAASQVPETWSLEVPPGKRHVLVVVYRGPARDADVSRWLHQLAGLPLTVCDVTVILDVPDPVPLHAPWLHWSGPTVQTFRHATCPLCAPTYPVRVCAAPNLISRLVQWAAQTHCRGTWYQLMVGQRMLQLGTHHSRWKSDRVLLFTQ
jgi:hypothetical protein